MMLPRTATTTIGLLALLSFVAAGNSTFFSGINPYAV
jgi:hypothetical protein